MTNHEHYFGTPEAASRMEVRFLCRPIRVEVWAAEPMTTVATRRRIIKDFTGVRDYPAWLEAEYDDGTIVFEEDQMQYIKLGNVKPFPNAAPTKAQALKVLEEASETVEAFKKWFLADGFQKCNTEKVPADFADGEFADLMDEIADTIQASCNLAAALGVTDLTPYLARCEERNRHRGRYDR